MSSFRKISKIIDSGKRIERYIFLFYQENKIEKLKVFSPSKDTSIGKKRGEKIFKKRGQEIGYGSR